MRDGSRLPSPVPLRGGTWRGRGSSPGVHGVHNIQRGDDGLYIPASPPTDSELVEFGHLATRCKSCMSFQSSVYVMDDMLKLQNYTIPISFTIIHDGILVIWVATTSSAEQDDYFVRRGNVHEGAREPFKNNFQKHWRNWIKYQEFM